MIPAASTAVCCGLSCLSNLTCCALSCCLSHSAPRLIYIGIIVVATLFCVAFRYWIVGYVHTGLSTLSGFHGCGDDQSCLADQITYRIAFSTSILYALIALFLSVCCSTSARRVIHDELFWLKILLWLGMIVGSLFLPTDVFSGFSHVAAVGGGCFIIVQILVLIDFAYYWNDTWVKFGEEKKAWLVAVLISSVLLFAATITIVVLMGTCMIVSGGCGREIAFIVITCIACVIITGMSITEWCEKASLLSAMVVSLYATYICWSALTSDPDCIVKSEGGTFQLVMGIIVLLFSIAYSAYSAATSDGVFALKEGGDKTAPLLDRKNSNVDDDADKESKSDEKPRADVESHEAEETVSATPLIYFHIILSLAVMYMSMLVTGWNLTWVGNSVSPTVSPTSSTSPQDYNVSSEAMWIKIVSQWVALLMYTWSLVAPKILTNRDFS